MKISAHRYSGFLETLYDQQSPVGTLGRGTHHSILLSPGSAHKRVGVIWDEDHDIRVIHIVERMHFKRLLKDVMFVGERKGVLSIILARQPRNLEKYVESIRALAQSLNDPWFGEVTVWPDVGSIIQADEKKVRIYLRSISMLWSLKKRDLPSAAERQRREKFSSLLRELEARKAS